MNTGERRWSSSSSPQTTKFPDYDFHQSPVAREHETIFEEEPDSQSQQLLPRTTNPSKTNGSAHGDRWAAYKENSHGRANGHIGVGARRGHNRQKSLSDAIRTINSRRGSVSANAQEIAEALKAPVSYTLIVRTTSFFAILSPV